MKALLKRQKVVRWESQLEWRFQAVGLIACLVFRAIPMKVFTTREASRIYDGEAWRGDASPLQIQTQRGVFVPVSEAKPRSPYRSRALSWFVVAFLAMVVGTPFYAMAAEKAAEHAQLETLVNDLKSSDPTKASSAAQALKAKVFPAEEAVPALAKAIRHPNEMVRLTVIGALSEMGKEAGAAVPELAEALKDKDPMIREAAALALFSIQKPGSEAVEGLCSALGDPSRRVRDAAVLALVSLGKSAIPALLKALGSSDETTRTAAVAALARIGEPAVPGLVEILEKGEATRSAAAIVALGGVGARAVEPLIELLKGGDKKTAMRAGKALEAIGAPAVPVLVQEIRRE